MTLPDPARPRKPRRRGLYAPIVLALIVAAGWSLAWVWTSGEVGRRLDTARADLTAQGYQIAWKTRTISGFPFRLDVDFTDLRLKEPSGWGVDAPVLKAEAFAYAPTHWVFVAPDGGAFTRPVGGRVLVGASALRASLSHPFDQPPTIAVEGLNLTFQPVQGAKPFFMSAAKELHFHLKAGPLDQGAIYFGVVGANAKLDGLIGRIAEGGTIDLTGDGIFSHASALSGGDWPTAARAWRQANGALGVTQVRMIAGGAMLEAKSGTLSVDPDGRLWGDLDTALRQAPKALTAMGEAGAIPADAAAAGGALASAQGDQARLHLRFRGGQAYLGELPIGPAPKLF